MCRQWAHSVGCTILILGLYILDGRNNLAQPKEQLPLWSVVIVMKQGTLNSVGYQFRRFAETYQFAIRFASFSLDPEDVRVEMWREDVKVKGANTSETGAAEQHYDISFYQTCDLPLDQSVLEAMVKDFDKMLSDVQGVISTKIERGAQPQ